MAKYWARLAGGLSADQVRLVKLVVWIIIVIVTLTYQHHL